MKRLIISLIILTLICVYQKSLWSQVQYSGTINTGDVASAINYETVATGTYSFATGFQSVASGHTSTAMGYQSNAEGTRSFAIGEFCYSTDQGFAIGRYAKSNASQSFTFGRYVEGNASRTFVFGASVDGYPLVNNIPNSIMFGILSTRPTLFISESDWGTNFDGLGKVGIGTTEPVARLQVAEGDIFIEDVEYGIVMKSPDGNCWRGTLNNDGLLEFEKLPDCNLTTSIEEAQNEYNASIKVFPNPATNYIEVKCSISDKEQYQSITLNNLTGELVLTIPLTSTSTKLSLDNIVSGSYILTLVGIEKSYSEIVIVK